MTREGPCEEASDITVGISLEMVSVCFTEDFTPDKFSIFLGGAVTVDLFPLGSYTGWQ